MAAVIHCPFCGHDVALLTGTGREHAPRWSCDNCGETFGLDTEPPESAPQAQVRVQGDLDFDTSPGLQAAIERLIADGQRTIEVDMARVHSIGVSALGVLATAHEALQEAGGRLIISHAPAAIRRKLDEASPPLQEPRQH